MKLSDLIKEALPDLNKDVFSRLSQGLEKVGREIFMGEAAKITSRALLKSLDAFIAVAVANLSNEDAEELSGTYADALNKQLEDLGEALFAYIPLQIAVEEAKQKHGSKSSQANAARILREAGIREFRAEVKDVFLAAVGSEPGD